MTAGVIGLRPSETAPVRSAVLRSVMRSEWTKLRTVRSTVWALALGQ